MSKNRNRVKKWLYVILWCGLIFAGSSLPKAELPTTTWFNWIAHKIVHLAEYGVLAYLFHQALEYTTHRKLLAVFLTVLYAISDEYHQTFVPGRYGKITDVLIDSLGAIVVLWKNKNKG